MREKKRILVVDDEVDFTRLMKMNLERTGKYQVRIENQSVLALEAAKVFKPHLILLDILMPDVMGNEVAAQLKEDEGTKDIPIIFLTAVVGKDEVTKMGSVIGGRLFLAKPVEMASLLDMIEKNS